MEFPFTYLDAGCIGDCVIFPPQASGQAACPVTEHNTARKRVYSLLSQRLVEPRLVELVHFFGGGKHLVRKIAVVCDNQKPFRILVEPSCREQPLAPICLRHKVDYCFRAMVARGA